MAENTKIEWADHTWNPWEGCQKMGPGCDSCYAEARNARFGRGQAVNWGPGAPRRRTSPRNWEWPGRWQDGAAEFHRLHGRRQRVFCASLADWADNAVPDEWRMDLATVILACPDLDFLMLTKRIGNVERMLREMFPGGVPANFKLGISVVTQAEADRDVMRALRVKAALRITCLFLSCEPLLESLQLWKLRAFDFEEDSQGAEVYPLAGLYAVPDCDWPGPKVDWVIVGGESGPHARPLHPDWVRSLRDQCANKGTPFLFKQWGEWAEFDGDGLPCTRTALEGDPEYEDQTARCDAFISHDGVVVYSMREVGRAVPYRGLVRIGKKAAGRLLDGIEHNGFPGA